MTTNIHKSPVQLLTGSTYPAAATQIAGKHYEKYETVLQPFLLNIAEMHPHISVLYPYVFTGSHNMSWLPQSDINKYIQLEYTPNVANYFYTYHEIYRLFLAKNKYNPSSTVDKITSTVAAKRSKLNNIVVISLEHGLIEYLNYCGLIQPATHIHFIGTERSTSKFQDYITTEPKLSSHKHITAENKLNKLLYDLLELDFGKPADIMVFNYYTFYIGINYNFAFLQILTNFVSMLLALKTLAKGGTFIMHMYAIINKSSADVFLILSKYFKTADLYFPESSNEYFATGTWAIFTGFQGINKTELDNLFGILTQIKHIYPNGLNDMNIYDEYIRKKCLVFKQIDNTIPHDYILGYLPEYTNTDPIYTKIRRFNNATYARKYKFTNALYDLWKAKKHPNIYLLPTRDQNQASISYLNKWGFAFTFNNNKLLGTEPNIGDIFNAKLATPTAAYTYLIKTDYLDVKQIDYELRKRGNWVPYDPARHEKLDYFYIDGLHIADRSLFGIKCTLKNLVGDGKKAVTVKNNLYNNLIKIPGASTFLPWTLAFDIKDKPLGYLYSFQKYFVDGKPLICKIVNMGEGQNMITTNQFQEFFNFMKPHFQKLKKYPGLAINKWVLQEYIDNPYLIKGKKFHVRLMLVYQPGDRPSYYMHHSRMALADAPYVKGAWTDKSIHDTHFHKTPGLNWPYEFALPASQIKNIYYQYDFICSCIVNSIQPGCYQDSQNCYEVFGVDLMFTDDLKVKLIEVNDRIGISADRYFKNKLFNGVFNLVVDEYFPPINKQIMPGTFFKIRKLDDTYLKSRISSTKTKKAKTAKSHPKKLYINNNYTTKAMNIDKYFVEA